MITRLSDEAGHAAARDRIEEIFFLSSGADSGLVGADKKRFWRRWTEYYLSEVQESVLLYRTPRGVLAAYLTGCPDSAAARPLYDDLFYYRAFEGLYGLYPAHFHVNCHPDFRDRGIGAALVEFFVAECGAAGLAGVHLVTAAGARNRRFYARCGFAEQARRQIADSDMVLLGRLCNRSDPVTD